MTLKNKPRYWQQTVERLNLLSMNKQSKRMWGMRSKRLSVIAEKSNILILTLIDEFVRKLMYYV